MTPLVIRMIDGLEQFVEMDVPFNLDERRDRVEFLRTNVDRSDLTVAEKFRQVLEAYNIELQYGRGFETYSDTIELAGGPREVDFLRIGRIALVYQTTDGRRPACGTTRRAAGTRSTRATTATRSARVSVSPRSRPPSNFSTCPSLLRRLNNEPAEQSTFRPGAGWRVGGFQRSLCAG
jgi:hypothetical protein